MRSAPLSRRASLRVLAGTAAVTLASVLAAQGALGASSSTPASPTEPPHARVHGTWTPQRVCGQPSAGSAQCSAVRLDPPANPSTRPAKRTTTTTAAPSTTTSTSAPSTTSTSTTTPSTTSTTTPSTSTTSVPSTTTSTSGPSTTVTTAGCAFSARSPLPSGYAPCDLQNAYALTAAAGAALSPVPTVAIVDAYGDPTAESDLGTYRSEYGLPVCTTANGCFRKVNETGGSSYPSSNTGWSEETALDLDMVSATCPYCHILLVDASSNGYNDLGAAVDEAASLGAAAISNSYGGSEWSGEATEDPHYDHPGIAVTASAGDGDYGVEYPAASPYVTAVGGTSLRQASTARGWTETVWGSQLVQGRYQGTGSGCSAYEPQPAPQAALGLTACSHRMVADVAADADPYTGVAVYDTEGGEPGWKVFGGTSAASPLIASVYALSGQTAGQGASLAYANTASLFDVTSGSNSPSGCSPSYLCTGQVGYDGPTGLGTPDGLSAF